MKNDYLLPRFIWIMFDDLSDLQALRMTRFYIPYNCQFLLIIKMNDFNYEIYEIYNIKGNKRKFNTKIGDWSRDRGLNMAKENFYLRRLNMEGLTLLWNVQREVNKKNLRNVIIK